MYYSKCYRKYTVECKNVVLKNNHTLLKTQVLKDKKSQNLND